VSHPQGAAVLYQRLRSAAHRVCESAGDERNLIRAHEIQACLQNAVGSAVVQVGSAELQAIANAGPGRPAPVLARSR
jgi:UrcA family protein